MAVSKKHVPNYFVLEFVLPLQATNRERGGERARAGQRVRESVDALADAGSVPKSWDRGDTKCKNAQYRKYCNF